MRHYTKEDKLDLAKNAKTEKERTEIILADIEREGLPRPFPRASSSAPRPGRNLSIDLDAGVKMEFVWIQALKMWVGKYEVTNGQYRRMLPGHDSKEWATHSFNGDRQPVVYVHFDDARKYAAWLTEGLRSAGALPTSYSFRLPTEKEWMTFAQCGDNRQYPWGDNWPPRTGQAGNYHGQGDARASRKIDGYRDGHPVTCDVESSWANPWGLYGVGGNVSECCAKDGNVTSFGNWRGAAWFHSHPHGLRCSTHDVREALYRNNWFGFRLVLSR